MGYHPCWDFLQRRFYPSAVGPLALALRKKYLSNMKNFKIHECNNQGPGIRVEYSRSYFHERATWQLVVAREATEYDLENNHYLENVGDEIWSTVIEINNCPYCGEKLREESLDSIEFAHFDSSGWSVDIL